MRKILYILLTVVCVWVFTNNTYAQIRVINNKGTFFQIDTSKWVLSGIDIYNKNTVGNVGIGTFPNNARFVVSNGGSAILPAFKLKYPFSGAISDSILTWNPSDSTVRKITLTQLLNNNTIRSLNGLTVSTQTFATGTAGTNFNIVSSGSIHTFNFPNASSTNRGLLTNTDWNTFNNKIGIVTALTPAAVTTVGTTATINNTGAYWNANQLQTRNVASTAPTNGQVLTWNNTSSLWEPSTYVTNAWNLTGNAGTNPATNFLGTTDSQRLVFRTNNTEKMTILSDGSVGIGTAAPTNILHIDAINPLRLVGLQTNTTDTNLLVTTSTGVIQQRGILNLLSGKAILSLNGLTNSIQTFATGTTGTDFNILSSGSSHTFNFPNASSANRGLLTAANWTTFNNKIGIVTALTPAAVTTVGTTATINNTGAYWNANQLQTRNVASTAPTNGQVLTWNTTSSLWEPSTYVTNAWNLTGNAGTNPATNFLGTTDSQRLVFRTNNTEKMTILSDGSVGIGTAAPSNRLHIDATNPLRLVGLQNNTTDTNLLVTTSTGVIQQRGILNMLSGKAILSLNGLTNSTQTFSIGTAGTNFNIVSSGSIHTFNFPNASSANRGLLTAADWSTFNNKIGIVTALTPAAVTTAGTTATINNTGAYWNANQLQTRNVASTAPTNGQVLTWNNTTSVWEPSSNISNDAKDHHVTRSNATTNVAPTSLEIPTPITGHTAKVHLTNGRVEYWSYNGSIWVLDWTQIPPVDGIDVGYIVAWGSNATPPDYLLPLTGGTYNWVDFPHLQSLQATHPSQFIASSNATTFTLVDINTSARFLRGGLAAGVNQNGATAMPINPFVLSNNTHNHDYTNTIYSFTNQRLYNNVDGNVLSYSSESNNNMASSDDTHTHTITSGGDSETRPINTSVIWCLKAKPTMTAGNIIINTEPTTTTVSNAIVGNQLTTTVNGVSSTPVTLPTPEPTVVEIYDADGTQALTTSFSDLTFGTTNIADAGYTIGGSGSQITISTTGTYRITYRVTARVTNNTSSGGEFLLTLNGSEVNGTRGYTYNHNSNRDKGTVTVVKLLSVSAGDVIRVQGRRYSSAGNLSLTANGSSLIIERIK